MKKLKIVLGSFRTKVTMALVFSIFLVMGLSDLVIYKFSLQFQFNQLQEKLKAIAQTSTLIIDADLLMQVPLNRQGVNSEAFRIIAQRLRRVKEANASVKYIYTLGKTGQEGIMQFIVDPAPVSKMGKKKLLTSLPGDRYNALRFPAMLKAFSGASADRKLEVDEWGVTLSGYAPIRDKNGKAVAILGVDMAAEDVYLAQKEVHRRAFLVLLVGFIVSIVLGLFISSRITRRLEKLVEGTRRIAAEDLRFQVEVKGHDEISELAVSFNKMASSLYESKKRLQNYFYCVVQSLVRILEAKDKYTKGHSQRVADYAKKIALSMGFSEEKSELLKETAELHDIGKLVIHEEILNKKGSLTEEEWKIIQEHPIVGEEALKSVLVDEEVLSMVRSHHERYDGKGYPDQIKGDNINIFSQIITVADAYDAMTSPRAYRSAMPKEDAIEELKRNCGSQFNTQVVKAFLKVLEEGKEKV